MTPPFPDYPSAHTVYAGAAETVLRAVFGAMPEGLEIASPSTPGVVHSYRDFASIADEVVDARVWGGVHWRSSDTSGRTMGRRLGRLAMSVW